MNRTNSIMLTALIIFSALFSIIIIPIIVDVNAQSIITGNSQINLTSIIYNLNISELNLQDSNTQIYYNDTNTTIIINSTNVVEYECDLNVNGQTYTKSQIVPSINYYEIINQTLSQQLSDGYYNTNLNCSYYINTTTITTNITENSTLVDTLLLMNTTNINTAKNILIDTTPMQLSILSNNVSIFNTTNSSIILNLSDISNNSCTINITADNNLNVYYGQMYFDNTNRSNNSITQIPFNIVSSISFNDTKNYTLNSTCIDELGNTKNFESIIYVKNLTNPLVVNTPFVNVTTSKTEFSLGEIGYYTINAINNSNVTITICPVASGWVQCYVTPTFVNDTFPKTQALPYTNKTGVYLIQAVMNYGNISITTNTTYTTINTLTASITITPDDVVGTGETVIFNASASLGIGTYKYRWVMHDGTVFNGPGAFKVYNTAGEYRVNLTANDTIGNNYTTSVTVRVKNYYTMTVIVSDQSTGSRIGGAIIEVSNETKTADGNGVATFRLLDDEYRVRVNKENYLGKSENIDLNSDKNVYINLSFQDVSPPDITLLTEDDKVMTKDSVDLKFKANDATKLKCDLYVAKAAESWYTLKDSGEDLLVNTEYTFELRDLENDAYKWKIECIDKNGNSEYSEERNFIVSDGSIKVALTQISSNTDQINQLMDNMDKLSIEELEVAETLGVKKQLKELLDKINSYNRDINDLVYRRDLDAKGKEDAQKQLTERIESMKYAIPTDIEVSNSKTFVKYVRDEELKPLLDEYIALKKLNIDKKLFFESTKLAQSKVIISTNVKNVKLFYLDGRIEYITLVTKTIQIAKPEDVGAIKSSTSITFLEVLPKSIIQSAKYINFVNKNYVVLKDDPIIEYPADTSIISYYLNDTIDPEKFEETDTVLVEKNTFTIKSATGLSIFGLASIPDVELTGQNIMIMIIVLLIIFYIVLNFELIDKVRNIANKLGWFGSGKKVSFIKVLVNDAQDYIKSGDYDKAALIYREIKLSYEEANDYVRSQVYNESMNLCNSLDYQYAMITLSKAEEFIKAGDRNNALMEFEKLEKTYSKLSDDYRNQLYEKFKKITQMITGNQIVK